MERPKDFKGTTREDMAGDTMVPGKEWYEKINISKLLGIGALKKSSNVVNLPPAYAETGFLDSPPYGAWRGPAPSAQKALETVETIRHKTAEKL